MEHPDPKLLTSFNQTAYIVTQPPLTIRIGKRHPELDLWLKGKGSSSWAYLTAWNPQSILLSVEQNTRRQKNMMHDLRLWATYPGQGIPDNSDWHAEESILIPGMPLVQALCVARKFEQLAFLYGEIGSEARLIWCADI